MNLKVKSGMLMYRASDEKSSNRSVNSAGDAKYRTEVESGKICPVFALSTFIKTLFDDCDTL